MKASRHGQRACAVAYVSRAAALRLGEGAEFVDTAATLWVFWTHDQDYSPEEEALRKRAQRSQPRRGNWPLADPDGNMQIDDIVVPIWRSGADKQIGPPASVVGRYADDTGNQVFILRNLEGCDELDTSDTSVGAAQRRLRLPGGVRDVRDGEVLTLTGAGTIEATIEVFRTGD